MHLKLVRKLLMTLTRYLPRPLAALRQMLLSDEASE